MQKKFQEDLTTTLSAVGDDPSRLSRVVPFVINSYPTSSLAQFSGKEGASICDCLKSFFVHLAYKGTVANQLESAVVTEFVRIAPSDDSMSLKDAVMSYDIKKLVEFGRTMEAPNANMACRKATASIMSTLFKIVTCGNYSLSSYMGPKFGLESMVKGQGPDDVTDIQIYIEYLKNSKVLCYEEVFRLKPEKLGLDTYEDSATQQDPLIAQLLGAGINPQPSAPVPNEGPFGETASRLSSQSTIRNRSNDDALHKMLFGYFSVMM